MVNHASWLYYFLVFGHDDDSDFSADFDHISSDDSTFENLGVLTYDQVLEPSTSSPTDIPSTFVFYDTCIHIAMDSGDFSAAGYSLSFRLSSMG